VDPMSVRGRRERGARSEDLPTKVSEGAMTEVGAREGGRGNM